MKRSKVNWILGLSSVILFFVFLSPEIRSFAGSASCTGSGPFICTLADAFDFFDYLVLTLGQALHLTDSFHLTDSLSSILLGIANIPFMDSFNLASVTPQIVISNPICSNPFVTSTICNPQSQGTGFLNFFDTGSTLGIVTTRLGIPIALIVGTIFIPAKWGVKSFYFIFPIVNFLILAMAWIGIIPPFFIIVDIIVVSAGIAFIVIQLFTGSSNSHVGA